VRHAPPGDNCNRRFAVVGSIEDGHGPVGPPPVSQNPVLPPLNLTDDQRAKIRQVLSTKNTEVTFQLKTTKPAQSFNPAVGAKLPTGLKANSLPLPLSYEMPVLKRYTYLKFKERVLIVNPMTGKIVDMFSET